MKSIFKIVLAGLIILTACKSEKKDKTVEQQNMKYSSFGETITDQNVIASTAMLDKFKTMKVGDTVTVKFASSIAEVCSKKGCWMKLPLNDSTETFVRFKDYGFFMPLNSKGKQVIVEGKAFIKETPVKELQHYAEDAGKSKEEIAKITKPKREFAFLAHGVLMKK